MKKSILHRLFNTGLFYAGWFLSLKEVSEGKPFYGLVLVCVIIFYHWFRSHHRKADGVSLLLMTALGPLSDTLYSKFGLLAYKSHLHSIPNMPPLWIFFLWALFASNIHLFSWLKKHRMLSILFGAVGGPISYMSAIRVGGADLLQPLPIAFLAIGSLWAIILPSSMWVNEYLQKKFRDL